VRGREIAIFNYSLSGRKGRCGGDGEEEILITVHLFTTVIIIGSAGFTGPPLLLSPSPS